MIRSGFATVHMHWPLLPVIAAFAAAACCIVPVLAAVAISDDWVYTRSVEVLASEGRLWISPIATAHLVFQVLWAGLFAAVLTPAFDILGVVRLSTVALWSLSGIALYGLTWELTHHRALSALAATAYLFNPLGYVLAFTFMTDAPFTAVFVIAAYCFVRGLRGEPQASWIVAGAVASAAGVLIRQPGLLIPAGVLTALLVSGRLGVNRASVRFVIDAAALPLLTYAVYYVWLTQINGVPVTQTLMRDQLLEGGWTGFVRHAQQLAVIEVTYSGLFVLPIALAALPAARGMFRSLSWLGRAGVGLWMLLVASGTGWIIMTGHRMPQIPHFLSRAGLGPNDLIAARAPVTNLSVLWAITALCILAALIGGVLLIRALTARDTDRRGITVVLSLLAYQVVGVFVVSVHFRFWVIDSLSAPSLDRYLLPIMPLTIVAVAWALRDARTSLPLGWAAVLLLGAFAVVGTRDNIAFHEAQWSLARAANGAGIGNLHLDAGASWDGYYVGEYSYEVVGLPGPQNRPWWLQLFAPAIDPHYTIAMQPVPGNTVVMEQSARLWLDPDARLYLLRRGDIPGPP